MRTKVILRTIDLSAQQSASWVRFVIIGHSNLIIDRSLRTSALEGNDQGPDHHNTDANCQKKRVENKLSAQVKPSGGYSHRRELYCPVDLAHNSITTGRATRRDYLLAHKT